VYRSHCGLVAEVVDRDVWPSTDGPVEHVHLRCVDRHRFAMPVDSLALHHEPAQQPTPGRQPLRVRVQTRAC
jgi:hypothetical protein